jgi:hypothetical protein
MVTDILSRSDHKNQLSQTKSGIQKQSAAVTNCISDSANTQHTMCIITSASRQNTVQVKAAHTKQTG